MKTTTKNKTIVFKKSLFLKTVVFKTIVFIKLIVSLTIVNDVPSLTIVNDDPQLSIVNEERKREETALKGMVIIIEQWKTTFDKVSCHFYKNDCFFKVYKVLRSINDNPSLTIVKDDPWLTIVYIFINNIFFQNRLFFFIKQSYEKTMLIVFTKAIV